MILTTASTVLAVVISAAAAPGLSLKISGPLRVNDVDSFSVVTTIVNTGNETLKLFNDPRGTLSSFYANSFAITSDTGASPTFVGAKVNSIRSFFMQLLTKDVLGQIWLWRRCQDR